ncbi:hypothetical protein M8371_30005, partial [Klebsiella pneumoniae]|nr:hypothetical protein [Klebsiella pneumoniae]
MKRKTGFFFDERCFWHSTGLHAVTLPVGGWVQPPAGGGHAESPETKRRVKNPMGVSRGTPPPAPRSAGPPSPWGPRGGKQIVKRRVGHERADISPPPRPPHGEEV